MFVAVNRPVPYGLTDVNPVPPGGVGLMDATSNTVGGV